MEETAAPAPPPRCVDCAVRRLALFRGFSAAELAEVQRLRGGIRRAARGAELWRSDAEETAVMTIYAGWAFSHVTAPHGGRLILDFHLPGDLVGAETLAVRRVQTIVEALTAVSACVFPRPRLAAALRENAILAGTLAWLMGRDEAVLHERLVSLGRRSAEERLAHLALELASRIRLRRRVPLDGPLPFPPTHRHLADALGLSAEAVSRAATRLRRHGLERIGRGVLRIDDPDRLAAFCGWEENYLTPREML